MADLNPRQPHPRRVVLSLDPTLLVLSRSLLSSPYGVPGLALIRVLPPLARVHMAAMVALLAVLVVLLLLWSMRLALPLEGLRIRLMLPRMVYPLLPTMTLLLLMLLALLLQGRPDPDVLPKLLLAWTLWTWAEA